MYTLPRHIFLKFYIPYARHYNPRFVIFLLPFLFEVRFILQTTYGLKTEILHFLSLKSAVYTRERLLIKSGLQWRAYGTYLSCLVNVVCECPLSIGNNIHTMSIKYSNNSEQCYANIAAAHLVIFFYSNQNRDLKIKSAQ